VSSTPRPREAQLAYSEQMAAMRDEDKRRRKAAKILAVLRHALGRSESEGLSGLNREYIRKSYLLASSYVSDVLKIQRGTEAWYDEFIKVMISLGWLPVRSSFERVSQSGKGLTVRFDRFKFIPESLAELRDGS